MALVMIWSMIAINFEEYYAVNSLKNRVRSSE